MCECDPNIRTPYCESTVCQEALKKLTGRIAEKDQGQKLVSLLQLRRVIVRHLRGGVSYTVDANYGNFVTAVRTQNIMNPSEWEIVS